MSQLRDSQKLKIEQPPLIIATHQQSGFQRYGFRLITVLFWLLFLLLFRVALTSLAWFVGFEGVYEMFSYKVDMQDFADLMLIYLLVVVAIGVCLIGWARYNQLRFRKNERRTRFRSPILSADVADFYQVSPAFIGESAHSRRLVLQHSEDGRLLEVSSRFPLPNLPPEPVPVEVNSYRYKAYHLQRGENLRWSVYQNGRQLFYGGTFNSCLDYVDAIDP